MYIQGQFNKDTNFCLFPCLIHLYYGRKSRKQETVLHLLSFHFFSPDLLSIKDEKNNANPIDVNLIIFVCLDVPSNNHMMERVP